MKTSKKQEVTDILVAINSVKRRAIKAKMAGEVEEYLRLFGDLVALEVCLVGSAEALIDELDQQEVAA